MISLNFQTIKLNLLALAVTLFAGTYAQAYIMCGGETYGGDVVIVSIRTAGVMGMPQGGQVSIYFDGGGTFAYAIRRQEIVQFYEDQGRAVVGLGAYVNSQGPVQIRYVGRNFNVDTEGEMIQTLRSRRTRISGNEMRVWRGPGYSYSSRYLFRDVVCSVQINP